MIFLNRLCVAVCAILFFFLLSASARELKQSYSIRDRGQLRRFEIATDEVQSRSESASAKLSKPIASVEDVRRHAKSLSDSSGEEIELVLYETGAPRTKFNRRILTKKILVELQPNIDAEKLAQSLGLQLERKFSDTLFMFKTAEVGGALTVAEDLRAQPGVISAEPQLAKQMQTRLLPNDSYFPQQWHLQNTGLNGGTAGMDVNITQVWETYRGAGIMIGIIDDGLQLTHPDLAANVNTNIDWDFNYDDNDPSPTLSKDWHGTAVAGVAGARGNNGIGVSGAAFESTLVSMRLVSVSSTDEQEYAAMLHSNAVIFVKNNSWGPDDGVGVLEGPGLLTRGALAEGALAGRDGKGTIYVWAGGNGGTKGDNANYDGYANSIFTFPIAAMADTGVRSDYSEPGACLVVTAPSSSLFRQKITTTDLIGNNGYNTSSTSGEIADRSYTKNFTGTSSAAPLVSGIIALILEANPNLGYRDVKEILMRSATKNSPANADWITNASGIRFNHEFGAGLVNAGKAIELATNWSNLGAAQQISVAQTNLSLALTHTNPSGVTRLFEITNENFRVEHVTLAVTLTHLKFGDLSITLTSPKGTESVLAQKHSPSSPINEWTFSTVRNWGENAKGIWTVNVTDTTALNSGTLHNLQLDLHGTVPIARMSLVQTSTNRQITLGVSGYGWNYGLSTSSNLVDWSAMGVFNITNNGSNTIIETNAPSHQQFYRAELLP